MRDLCLCVSLCVCVCRSFSPSLPLSLSLSSLSLFSLSCLPPPTLCLFVFVFLSLSLSLTLAACVRACVCARVTHECKQVLALWKGALPAVIKTAPATAITYTVYELCKYIPLPWESDHPQLRVVR